MTRKIEDRARWLADKFASQDKKIASLQNRGDLAYSSIEAGAIVEKDLNGNLVSSLGLQEDGSHVQVAYTGPIPAAPTVPQLKAVPGVVEVRWNGKFDGDQVSAMDFKHVAVHVSSTPSVDLTPPSQVATIRGELGDVATVTADPGLLYVALVAWSEAGKASLASPVAVVIVPAPADMEEIQEAIAATETRFSLVAPTETDIAANGAMWLQINGTNQVIKQWQQTTVGGGSTWEPREIQGTAIAADAIDGKIIRGVEIIGGTITGGWVTTVPASNGVTASLGMVGEPGFQQYPGIGFNQGPAVFRPAGMVSRYGDDIVLQSREQTAGENYAALTLGPDYDGLGAAEIYATDRIGLVGPKTTIIATTYIRLKTAGAVDFANIAGDRGDLTNVGTINGTPAPSADIPWARVPLQNSFTHYTEAAKWDGLRFTRRNRTLHINGAFTRGTSWATGQVIGTLAAAYRPTWRIKGQGCEIDPTGVIILTAAGSGPTTIEATVPLG